MAIDSRQQTTLVRQRCTLACVASGSGDPRVVKRRLAACLYSCHLFKKMTKFLAIIVAFLFATGLSCNMVNAAIERSRETIIACIELLDAGQPAANSVMLVKTSAHSTMLGVWNKVSF
ncbi:uncharacterized protein LOC142590322 isoform X2 [Dermacentor variabilis]|uniref:uncharacterized protein LOC142590322 isoform X2 n=1 Tax=Dermacentor variabilis TaxID=34621 RepID=UPI003F5B558E